MDQLDFTQAPDLKRLDAFLDSERAPPDTLSLSALDGLLTAIAVGPEVIRPEEWLDLVWGGDTPDFESKEEGVAIFSAMFALMNDILLRLDADPPMCEPLFWRDEDDRPIIEEWCYGFMAGVSMRPKKWARFMQSPEGVLLAPIMAFVPAFVEETPHFEPDEFNPDLALPHIALRLRDYWRSRKRGTGQNRITVSEFRFNVRVGRNEPCPCGSSAKFKRCCGASKATEP